MDGKGSALDNVFIAVVELKGFGERSNMRVRRCGTFTCTNTGMENRYMRDFLALFNSITMNANISLWLT
jgi:hypothetical protein